MWRSEGSASYFAALWPKRSAPADLAAELAPRLELGPQSPFRLGSPPPGQLFGGPIYEEGALLVADLRRTMGDDAFYAGLRTYFEQYGGGVASDLNFQAVMESAAGQPLDAVFAKWLE
jgi:aminopeptidase N